MTARVRTRATTTLRGAAPLLLAAALVAAGVLTSGCVRSTRSTSSIQFDEPRISYGHVIETDEPVDLDRLAAAIDAISIDPEGIRPSLGERSGTVVSVASADGSEEAPARSATGSAPESAPENAAVSGRVDLTLTGSAVAARGEIADLVVPPAVPPDAFRLFTLPKLSSIEIAELVEHLALTLQAQGYVLAEPGFDDVVPPLPVGVSRGPVLVRSREGSAHAVRIGYRRFLSQPAQLWVLGVVLADGAPIVTNPDLATLDPAVEQLVAGLEEMRTVVTVRDLEAKLIQLSYADASTAISMLKGFGLTTFDDPAQVPGSVEFGALPYVIRIADPSNEDIGLVGEGGVSRGEFGISIMPNVASELSPNTVVSPMTQLLVMFHPAHPGQFSRVREILDDFIDRPARQVFIEGMVLEIAEDGLRDLGVEWELNQAPVFFRFGSLNADGLTDTVDVQLDDVDLHRVFTRNFLWTWSVKIRALIQEGKAEVLSRPSVLTINNRQSTIRVGQDIPIATSQEGTSGFSNKIAFNFKYLPTGILLNIRPRINEDGSEVSMLVDTVVSATVPGADLEIRSNDGDLLATAPTVSTRRVQTYARIRNNTPFIIGGLVSRIDTVQKDKIPLLGDIPIIGAAFRSERASSQKREVIIVLTPHVLPEDQFIARSQPKDEEIFDSFDNELFRDSYRIRIEDVFDLRFLFENRRLRTYATLAREAITGNFRLAGQEPFRSFANSRFPGEEMLVTRMMYDVIKRLGSGDEIPFRRIIFFEGQDVGGFQVRFLDRALAQLGGGGQYRAFFRNQRGKALAITYRPERDHVSAALGEEPIPELALVDCPDRKTWRDLMWEMNRPDAGGARRATILIQGEEDLLRLRRAIVVKRIVLLNGGRSQLLLRNFSPGKVLLMPELKKDRVHVIDAEVARYFFLTEHYYAATVREIERRLGELDEALRSPGIRPLLVPAE